LLLGLVVILHSILNAVDWLLSKFSIVQRFSPLCLL